MDEIMKSAIELVVAERHRQIEKWGDQSGNHPFEWMSILGEEFGELCEAVNETCFQTQHVKPELGGTNAILREAVQVAAVAVSIIEAATRQQAAQPGHPQLSPDIRPMTRTDEIRARWADVTGVKWRWGEDDDDTVLFAVSCTSEFARLYSIMVEGADATEADKAAMVAAREDVHYLLSEIDRLTAAKNFAQMVTDITESFCRSLEAERDSWKRRAEAAVSDIRDMLHESTLLVDKALCSWCARFSETRDLCWAADCKAECEWRGPREKEVADGNGSA